jgi:hypothetical protein
LEPCGDRKAQGGPKLVTIKRLDPDQFRCQTKQKPGAVPRIASRVNLPDLRTHKKTDLGQAQDRRTLREFRFPEYTVLAIRASAAKPKFDVLRAAPQPAQHGMSAVRVGGKHTLGLRITG